MPLNDTAPVLRRRLAAALLAGALTVPAPAFAQGAGDDQYRDPFPETTAQDSQAGSTPTSTTGQGLSDTPPTSGTQGSGSSGGESTEPDATSGAETSGTTTAGSSTELARTGDDPWLVALAGGALLLLGAGLRLRGGAQRRH